MTTKITPPDFERYHKECPFVYGSSILPSRRRELTALWKSVAEKGYPPCTGQSLVASSADGEQRIAYIREFSDRIQIFTQTGKTVEYRGSVNGIKGLMSLILGKETEFLQRLNCAPVVSEEQTAYLRALSEQKIVNAVGILGDIELARSFLGADSAKLGGMLAFTGLCDFMLQKRALSDDARAKLTKLRDTSSTRAAALQETLLGSGLQHIALDL